MSTYPDYRVRFGQLDPVTYNPITGGTLVTFLASATPGRWRLRATARRLAGAGSTTIGLVLGPQTGVDTPFDGGPISQTWPSGGVVALTSTGWVHTIVEAGQDLSGFIVGNGVNGDSVDIGYEAEWIGPISGAGNP